MIAREPVWPGGIAVRAVWFRFGGVAQLGERLLCKQEVDGSIPFSSTRVEKET